MPSRARAYELITKDGLLNAYSYKTITRDNGNEPQLRDLNVTQISRFRSLEIEMVN